MTLKSINKSHIVSLIFTFLAGIFILYYKTVSDMNPVPESFGNILLQSRDRLILDRKGEILNTSSENSWNDSDVVELYQIPSLMINSFIISEDNRFFEHSGIDWRARLAAVYLNIRNLKYLRGASTITEQVVRLINNRPRTIWSKWIEGWEAYSLENRFSKTEILKFYLNQVPYASNRRGVAQAARYYFDRDLDTLTSREMLALVILVRAPSRLDLYSDTKSVDKSIQRLTARLVEKGILSKEQAEVIISGKLKISRSFPPVSAPHFIRYVSLVTDTDQNPFDKTVTTLDADIQRTIQSQLDKTLENLEHKRVFNAAVLAADHSSGEILAWVVGSRYNKDVPGSFIDSVTVPRQPGSALKPFLYALALDKGWTASTIIDDSPLTELVGNGLHSYKNYSRTFYGPVTLRQALANSLNIPAVRTLQYVGGSEYLDTLRSLEFEGLKNNPDFYGDGLSLGNGEVSLFQLVQAYSSLANGGVMINLTPFTDGFGRSKKRVFSEESASIIANILSDPDARSLEFGNNSVLNLPVQTAVKTGTSSDYRDAWAVGFNYKYTVGVWMGNLDQTPTDGLTGSTGPALLLRSIFNELNKHEDTRPLYLSPKLIRQDRCINEAITDITDGNCIMGSEWYKKGTLPPVNRTPSPSVQKIRLLKPTNGLHLAFNPRLPASSQYFEFRIKGVDETDRVIWNIDGKEVESRGGDYDWNIMKGNHSVSASVWRNDNKIADIKQVSFLVK